MIAALHARKSTEKRLATWREEETMAEFYGQAMSDVPFYVVHTIKDESARITRSGALKLLEAEVRRRCGRRLRMA